MFRPAVGEIFGACGVDVHVGVDDVLADSDGDVLGKGLLHVAVEFELGDAVVVLGLTLGEVKVVPSVGMGPGAGGTRHEQS